MAVKKGYELQDLVGMHVLDAVDFETVQHDRYGDGLDTEDASACRFRLDGEIWMVTEDPSDGYRSHMRDIVKLRSNTKVKMVNVFDGIPVFCLYRDREKHDQCELLEAYDTRNGKLILEVGTRNTDDYYPYFVASWHPENIGSDK